MKRILAILLISMLMVSSFPTVVFADESYLFRSIPWYSTKSVVSESLSSLSVSRNRSNTTLPDWFQRWNNIDGDYTVEEAGTYTIYKKVAVAGYKAELITYFMYPIVNGRVERNDDNAELYLALYEFEELTDMPAVYEDLVKKLTGLYGESSALNNPDNWTSFEGRLWKAEDGSQIWLRLYHMYGSYTLKLSYIAPDSTSRLQALEAQIIQEKIEAEELERQQNSDNTEGL